MPSSLASLLEGDVENKAVSFSSVYASFAVGLELKRRTRCDSNSADNCFHFDDEGELHYPICTLTTAIVLARR